MGSRLSNGIYALCAHEPTPSPSEEGSFVAGGDFSSPPGRGAGVGWEITQVYGATETSPFISICEPRSEHAKRSDRGRAEVKARQGVELVTSGDLRVVDSEGCAPRRSVGNFKTMK